MPKRHVSISNSVADRLLRAGEVADLLGLSLRSVWKLTADGQLPCPLKIGGATRWRASDIRQLMSGSGGVQSAESKNEENEDATDRPRDSVRDRGNTGTRSPSEGVE